MKKSRKSGMLGAGFALALGALTGGAQAIPPLAQSLQQTATKGELKATVERKQTRGAINVNPYGGLDFPPNMFIEPGMSPKEYGIRFGNGGSRVGKTNKQRLSHNAKLKRRRGK